jgi:hypothetical protein
MLHIHELRYRSRSRTLGTYKIWDQYFKKLEPCFIPAAMGLNQSFSPAVKRLPKSFIIIWNLIAILYLRKLSSLHHISAIGTPR